MMHFVDLEELRNGIYIAETSKGFALYVDANTTPIRTLRISKYFRYKKCCKNYLERMVDRGLLEWVNTFTGDSLNGLMKPRP